MAKGSPKKKSPARKKTSSKKKSPAKAKTSAAPSMSLAPSAKPPARAKSSAAVLRSPRIPTLPSVAMQILRLTRDPNVDLRKITEVVQSDQALALKILRTVNSSYYGLSVPCTTVKQAVVYLGANAVKALVLGFSLVESIDGNSDGDVGFDYVDYWRRALYSAAAARELAAIAKAPCGAVIDPEEAFFTALVQDIGMVALFRSGPGSGGGVAARGGDVYLQVIDMCKGDHRALIEIEQRSLRTDHAVVGAALAEHWRLPPQFVEAVRWHHSSEQSPDEHRNLIRCVELATELTTVPPNEDVPARLYDNALEWFCVSRGKLDSLLARLKRAVTELSRLFEVPTSDDFSRDTLLEEAEEARVRHEIEIAREIDRLTAESSPTASSPLKEARPAAEMRKTKEPAPPRARDELLSRLAQQFDDAIAAGENLALVLLEPDGRDKSELKGDEGSQADRTATILNEHDPSLAVHRVGGGRLGIVLSRADRVTAAREAESHRRLLESNNAPASIGVATIEPNVDHRVDSAGAMLRIAEQALEAAVKAGRNCVRVFSPEKRARTAA